MYEATPQTEQEWLGGDLPSIHFQARLTSCIKYDTAVDPDGTSSLPAAITCVISVGRAPVQHKLVVGLRTHYKKIHIT